MLWRKVMMIFNKPVSKAARCCVFVVVLAGVVKISLIHNADPALRGNQTRGNRE
jgi:hypothetical protein